MVDSQTPLSVLVVDDHPETLEIVRIPLESGGYRVETAANGLEGWEKIRDRPFDLLITDIMMPVLDGLGLCRLVKGDAQKQSTYIIILSAKTETEQKILGLETGADDYLEKPFAMAELMARVKAGERIVLAQRALETKQKALEELARRDSLTGLYNRRHFDEILELECQRAVRYRRPLSVAMADIDRFKQINDQLGHGRGDDVLKAVAGVLVSLTRQTDTVARYGGDEFAIMLPETLRDGAWVVGEKLQKAVESLRIELGDNTLTTTLSLGLASLEGDTGSWRNLIEEADKALYEAKAQGRNRLVSH